jgi:putative transposase
MSNPFRYFNSSPEVIRLVVMMYVRYPLSLRNVEDLLGERGIDISHETVRFWGAGLARCSPPRFVSDASRTCADTRNGAGTWMKVCREGFRSDVVAELHGR